ncbi:MAG: hypothetical protein SFY69_12745 [Planctomycetota bacterium]|nr:hypothetical protein [Planctomycetota bacterium]
MFERVKTLEGTWEMVDEKGERHVAATFTVSSNGTIVREVMFPGGAHEMTNIYHMDGPTLLLTHYCAMGNQPRMRARELRADQIAFAHDSVTNLDSPETAYMGEMTLVFTGPDTVLQEWRSIANGTRDASHDVSIRLTRRR